MYFIWFIFFSGFSRPEPADNTDNTDDSYQNDAEDEYQDDADDYAQDYDDDTSKDLSTNQGNNKEKEMPKAYFEQEKVSKAANASQTIALACPVKNLDPGMLVFFFGVFREKMCY